MMEALERKKRILIRNVQILNHNLVFCLFYKVTRTASARNQNIKHFLVFLSGGGSNAARIASSNTFFKPFCKAKRKKGLLMPGSSTTTAPCKSRGLRNHAEDLWPTCVKAEHSTYLTAFKSLANFSPISMLCGFCLFLASLSIVAASSLKSI